MPTTVRKQCDVQCHPHDPHVLQCFALPICFEFRLLFQLFQAGRGEVENDQCSFLGQAHFGLCPGGPGGVERVRSGLLGRLVLNVFKEMCRDVQGCVE